MSHEYNAMLSNWYINQDQVHLHVIVRDNASNMVKARILDVFPILYTLQLVINDGIFSQRVVINLLAICRQM